MSPRRVVAFFAVARTAIGVVAAVRPDSFGAAEHAGAYRLITQSFAVRELVLGVGALHALSAANGSLSAARTWAGLGALTDSGDLAAALATVRRGDRSAILPAGIAAVGLVAEAWAFSARR
ncbi:MAG: hypothetical protein JO265_04560 [Acidimicrobiia bacterium]|nr:hypothetical protein [Acidimicrobiia bacterium]